MNTATRTQPRLRTALAGVLSLLLAFAGLSLSILPASAVEAPAVTITPNSNIDPAAANTFTISGTGFTGDGALYGAYVAVGATEVWAPGQVPDASKFVATGWVMPAQVVNGAFTTTLAVAAGKLDPALTYGVSTFAAHQLSITDRSLDTFTPFTLTVPAQATTTALAAPATAVVGTPVSLTATIVPANAAGSVQFFDGATPLGSATVASGTASINAPFATAGARSVTAVFTPTDTSLFAASTSAPSTTVVSAAVVPTVTVSKTTLSEAGETITVTGSGFLPAAPATNGTRAPLAGVFSGVYVAFGKYADVWRPSAGAASSVRKNDQTNLKWFVNAAEKPAIDPTGTGAGGAALLNADGSFTTTFTVKPGFTGELSTGNYGIYSYSGSGAVYAPFETYTPITFVPVPVADPKVTVTPDTDVDPAVANTFTVSGTGFVGAGAQFGAYVAVGAASVWAPGQVPDASKFIKADWVMPASIVNGAFTTTIVAPAGSLDPTVSYGVSTFAAHQLSITDRTLDSFTPFTLKATVPVAVATTTTLTASPASVVAGSTSTLTATVSPTAAGTVTFASAGLTLGTSPLVDGVATLVTAPLTAGTTPFTAAFTPADATQFIASSGAISVEATPVVTPPSAVTGLDWGVKASFRSYIVGAAQGSITPTGVTATDGIFNFPSKAGGSYDTTTGTGTSLFTGGVRFFGHAGLLDLTFSDPSVRITSPTTATLIVKVNGGAPVTFASLDLAAGTKSLTSTALSFADVPAVLTAEGAAAFQGFYSTGAALDPVSFQVDTTATVPEVPTPTIAATTTTLVASPATVAEGSTTRLTATVAPATTGTVTFRVGTEVLGTAKVTAGKATFTTQKLTAGVSRFSASFAPTSALYSGSSGAVAVTVTAKPATPTDPETPAVGLKWGVKESFRSYIVGPIAQGSIDVAGATFANGIVGFTSTAKGTFNGTTGSGVYTGSVRFTGHGGLLDIAIANPVVRVDSSSAATLLVDVNGTKSVAFATLDLTAATKSATDAAVSYSGIPATLTAAGAASFDGFYPAGTELDTVDVQLPVKSGTTPTDPEVPTVPVPPVTPVTPTSLVLAASPDTLAVGGSTTLSAQVSPVASGSISFVMGQITLGVVAVTPTGGATFTVDNLPVGVHTFTATFAPADTTLYSGASATAAVSVVAKTVGAGSLKWGVKQSFRDYVTGTIAKGAISTSGVASSGGVFTFGQSSGGSFDFATGVGTSNYNGTVRFTGHAGALDIALSNPVVRIDSATRGTLLVSVNGGASTPFATLDLGAGTRTTPDNTVSYAGVPTSLTAEGAAVFSLNGSGFYPVGTALDPVSFVIGAPNVVSATVGATVASFTPAKTPAATPPATTGITVAQGTELVAGDEVTITATGFQPNETGILVVIYSTPTVLDTNATADATGTVTWTGRLPAELSGLHTLTFQGSVDRGVELTIAPAAASEAVTGCLVDDATITWGFKESFRAYISGSIANGEWTVADGATYAVPDFGWSAGTGGYDAESGEGLLGFAGSINFTGHSGVLNTTVANPQIRFVDADSAVLLLDISGTTQDGAAIDTKAVEFADLDLSGVLENDEGSVTITAAPATLTAAGAAAFGTYPAGEELDPVTVAFTTAADCAVAAEEESTPAVTSTTDAVSSDDAIDYGWIVWVILALIVIAAAVVVTVVVRRRKA